MTAPEPDLFDMAAKIGRTIPEDGRIGLACFIEGQRVKAIPRGAPEVMIVKAMRVGAIAPQDRDAQAQRLDRIPDADHLDMGVAVTMGAGKGLRGAARRRAAVMAKGLMHIAFGRLFGAQKADAVDHPRQRAHRIGPARIAHQEYPVAGPVAIGEIAIGAANLAIDTAPHDDIAGCAPVTPLNPRLVIEREIGPRHLAQQFIGEASVGFIARCQARHGAIEDQHMIDRTAPVAKGRMPRAWPRSQPIQNAFGPSPP